MKKKNIRMILVILFLLLLTSCSQGENMTTNKDPQPEPAAETPDTNLDKNPSQQPNDEEPDKNPDTSPGVKPAEPPDNNNNRDPYEITKANYTDHDIKINYPQITKSSDQQKEGIINALIKHETMKVLNYYLPEVQDLTLEINYEIKSKSASLLSIQYTGVGYMNGAASPNNHFYTTTIDFEMGNSLRLKDMVNIDKNFVENLKQNAKAIKPEHQSILNSIATNELLNMLTNADSLDNIGTENQSDTFSYFTSDSLGISIPISHAEGDHAVFEISYQTIAQNINSLLLLSLLQQ
jgi:hypothetical protein